MIAWKTFVERLWLSVGVGDMLSRCGRREPWPGPGEVAPSELTSAKLLGGREIEIAEPTERRAEVNLAMPARPSAPASEPRRAASAPSEASDDSGATAPPSIE